MLTFFNKHFEVTYYIYIQKTRTFKEAVKKKLSIKFVKYFNQ